MVDRRPLTLRTDVTPNRLQELPAGDQLPPDTLANALAVVLQGLVTNNNAGITAADTVLQALGKLQAQSSNKVDKDGSKVLSDNNYTNAEREKLANIGDSASNDRSKHTGTQPIASVDTLEARLDAALRVKILTPSNTKELLQLMWANGPGYYRVDNSNTAAPIFSAGFFSQVADTFSALFTDYTNANSVSFSGWSGDIDAGTWRTKYLADRGTHTGTQPFNTVDELVDFRRAHNAGGFPFEVNLIGWDPNTWYPWLMSGDSLNTATGGSTLARARLQAATTLGYSGTPSWAQHPNGVVCNLDVEVTNGAWGTAEPYPLKLRDNYAHIKPGEPPPAVYAQFTNASAHIFYLRGGARYQLRSNVNGVPWEFANSWTLNGELIAPLVWADLKNLEQANLPLLPIGADGSRLTNTIDSGVTGTGSWLKLKDGTLICSCRATAGTWNYPVWFTEKPKITHSVNGAAGSAFSFTIEENATDHMKCNLAWWNGSGWQINAGETLDLVAYGRWKP